MNKQKIVSLFTVALITGSLFAVSQPAYAAESGGNFFSGLIQFISQKFGLDKSKVQTALQDYKKQTKATITPRPTISSDQQQAQEKKRLDPFVSQGKITADQENALIAELATLRAKYKLDPKAPPEQRKTQTAAMQNELKTWATAQGIDLTVLPMLSQGKGWGEGIGGGRMGGAGIRGERKPKPTTTP